MKSKNKPKTEFDPKNFNPYIFYKQTEEFKRSCIGTYFKERSGNVLNFIVGLSEDGSWANYGERFGILSLNKPVAMQVKKSKLDKYIAQGGDPSWFQIYCVTPDDGDYSLQFSNLPDYRSTYHTVKQFLIDNCPMFIDTQYNEILPFIQSELKIGTLEY